MRVSFVADMATFDEIEGALVVGLAMGDGGEGYLLFQRSTPDAPKDCGVYLEYNDQGYSGYNLVAGFRVSRGRVEVDLSKPLGNLKDVTGIDVDLRVDDVSYERFLRGLKQVFREEEVCVVLDEELTAC